MGYNRILKVLCSFPIIVLISYYIPFVGVCLIITRYFVYSNKKYYSTSVGLIIIGIMLSIPSIIDKILGIVNIKNSNIPYLDTVINSNIYPNILNCSKFLLGAGIIFLIISLAFRNLFNKLSNYIRSYINTKEQINRDISQKNDMEMKIKQEKAQIANVVYCPHCGADNILSETVGKCKYCRRSLNNKEKR